MVAVREQVGDAEAERSGDRLRGALVGVAPEDGAAVSTDADAERGSVIAVVAGATGPKLVLLAMRPAAVSLERVPEQAKRIGAHAATFCRASRRRT
jgi:hypothetical protein